MDTWDVCVVCCVFVHKGVGTVVVGSSVSSEIVMTKSRSPMRRMPKWNSNEGHVVERRILQQIWWLVFRRCQKKKDQDKHVQCHQKGERRLSALLVLRNLPFATWQGEIGRFLKISLAT